MFVNEDRTRAELLINRVGRRIEKEVGVEIGKNIDVRVCLKNAEEDRGRQRPVIFDERPCFFCLGKLDVAAFDIVQGDGFHAGHVEFCQKQAGNLVKADDIDPVRVFFMPRQRPDERQGLDEIIAVEIGAVITHYVPLFVVSQFLRTEQTRSTSASDNSGYIGRLTIVS